MARNIVIATLVSSFLGLAMIGGALYWLEGAWATSIRIWWHFVMVLVPTGLFLLALREFWRARPLTTAAPAGAPTAHEAPEHKRTAQEIPVSSRERHPPAGGGVRNPTGQGRG